MEVAEFHAAVVAVDLEADAAGLENFRGEIVFGGGLLAVYPDGATSTLDADLEEEPAALEIGLERTALAGVEGAGLVDGIDGGVDLDLEAAVGPSGWPRRKMPALTRLCVRTTAVSSKSSKTAGG